MKSQLHEGVVGRAFDTGGRAEEDGNPLVPVSFNRSDRGYAKKRTEREGAPAVAERKRLPDEALDNALTQTFPANDPVAG